MAYRLYLDGTLFPVIPSKLTLKINGNNETVTLINEGEAVILKQPGLTDIEFELLLPAVEYAFAVYPDGFRKPQFYTEKLEALMTAKQPFQYIVTRTDLKNKKLFDTNMTVCLQDYSIVEDAGEGFDLTVKVKLKQYREFTTKQCTLDISLPKPLAAMQQTRASSQNAPSGGSYTVQKLSPADCLWRIAKQFYGDGNKWNTIYNANKSVIGGNPNLIYPGQVLTIP